MITRFLAAALVTILLLPAAATAAAPTHLWSDLYGNVNDQYGQAVAIDGAGNVLVAGTFWGSIDLGGGVLTSAGLTDVFLAKFDPAGAHLWSVRFGDTNFQTAASVTVDVSGRVAFAGNFRGTVDFGGGNLTSTGASDIFVVVFDAAGAHQWSRRFGAAASDYGNGVAFDAAGNVLLTGSYVGTVDFGGGDLTGAGGQDVFVASFDAAGAHRWSRRFGDFDHQNAWGVSVDPAGRVGVGGVLAGSADFGGGDLVSAGGTDAFVAVFDSLGGHEWSARFGDAADQACFSVAMDAAHHTWASGAFAGSMDLGGGPLTSAGATDVFAAKFDSLGVHQFGARFGDAAAQTGYAVALDGAGNAFLTGKFSGAIDFGGPLLTSAGGEDIFVAALSATGAYRWSGRFGDTGNDGGYWIAARSNGDFALTGFSRGTVDFGGGALTGAGGADAVLAVFSAVPSAVGTPLAAPGLSLAVYPNPFNPSTTVGFTLPEAGPVTVEIFDSRGGRVTTLIDREERPSGATTVAWNGTDEGGNTVSSGVYFARVSHASATGTHKMVLIK